MSRMLANHPLWLHIGESSCCQNCWSQLFCIVSTRLYIGISTPSSIDIFCEHHTNYSRTTQHTKVTLVIVIVQKLLLAIIQHITSFKSKTILRGIDNILYSIEYFHIETKYGEYPGIFYIILSIPHNIVLDLNNVRHAHNTNS